jgi:hypothetical protein
MIVDATLQKTTVTTLEEKLKAQILAKVKSAVPADYIFYDNAYTIEYTHPEPTMTEADKAEITVKATGYGIMFKEVDLMRYIAGKEIQKFPSPTYTIKGDKDLQFVIVNTKDLSIKKETPVIFTLKGPIILTGTFSEEKLKEELKGSTLTSSNTIFSKYQAISNAYARITPFWIRHFPNSIENILFEYKTE